MSTSQPISVALDVTGLQVDSARIRGIGSYVRNLRRELASRRDVSITTWGFDRAMDDDDGQRPDIALNVRAIRDQRLTFPQLALRSAKRWSHHEVVHYTSMFATGAAFGLPKHRYVATIFDLIPLMWPETYLQAPGARWAYRRYLSHLRGATRLLAISCAVADDAATRLDYPRDRICVTPLGVTGLPDGHRDLGRLLQQRYVFLAGTPDPHKNALFGIDAVAQVSRPPPIIVMTGANAHRVGDLIRYAADRDVELLHLNRVTRGRLGALYRHAEVVLVPSRYEGFGLQVIEAMSAGGRVIASDRGALPEVVGDAGRVLPLEVATWARAIEAALDGDWPTTPEQARRYANRFTWSRCAESTIDCYRRLA